MLFRVLLHAMLYFTVTPPQLKTIAPEFYLSLMHHTSYTWVLWWFLSDAAIGPWSRIKRRRREGPLAPCMAPFDSQSDSKSERQSEGHLAAELLTRTSTNVAGR